MMRLLLLSLLSLSLLACTTMKMKSPADMSWLAQGKRDFENGYYKRAMQELLPLACDGNAEAQYAVGYMYYYGYGVSQDTEVGTFWIRRSAKQHYEPAMTALAMIESQKPARLHQNERWPIS